MNSEKVVLGAKYKDEVSGFEGIATAKVQSLTGADRAEITGRSAQHGALSFVEWFDETRLVRIGDSVVAL